MKKDEEGLEQSIEDAILIGIPENEAKQILKKCNEKVFSGEWIELKIVSVGSTTNPGVFPHAISLCRYWGQEKYKNCTKRQMYKLYNKGIIGKTHEMIRGSDKYKDDSSLSDGGVSIPSPRRVLHRHWEISRMHRRENGKYKPVLSHADNVKDLCGIEYGIYPGRYPGELRNEMEQSEEYFRILNEKNNRDKVY